MKENKKKYKYIVGIDEAGRGPLAGPVTVAAVATTISTKFEAPASPKLQRGERNSKQIQNSKYKNKKPFDKTQGKQTINPTPYTPYPSLKDSKKLTRKQREEWFLHLCDHPKVICVSASVSAKVIDKIGITRAVRLAANRCVKKLENLPRGVALRGNLKINSKNTFIQLDGLLKAPGQYDQETIIKGDERIPIISAASVIAKVVRDRKMGRYHKKHPQYCLDQHKGYGTKLHYKKIKKHGCCDLHRKSYLTKIK